MEKKILLVDDSIENKVLICAFLKNTHFQVEWAQNGLSALQKLKTEKYNLVLMDIEMPEMDGLTTTREFRLWEKEHPDKTMTIVALTALRSEAEKIKIKEAGFDHYLSKPIKKDELIQTLEELCIL